LTFTPAFVTNIPPGYRVWSPALQSRAVRGKQQSLWPRPIIRTRHPDEHSVYGQGYKKVRRNGRLGFAHFQDGKPGDEAMMKTCFPCHNEIKARDLVFTRYAP
jgi:hypothetical protein